MEKMGLYLYERLVKSFLDSKTDIMSKCRDAGIDCETLMEEYTPECVLVEEEEQQARAKAIHHGKRLMTQMEKKVFTRLLKGLTEETVANQLHISQPRVNKLKSKAMAKVEKIYKEIR